VKPRLRPLPPTRPQAIAFLLLTCAVRAFPQEGTEITGRDLARLGFFQDFAELSLEDLLTTGELRTDLASRSAETPAQAPGIVSVVTAEQIRQLGARTLDEVLRTVAGLDVVTTNLGRSRIVVRGILPGAAGGSSDAVLLLMNGRRLNEELTGGATVANLLIPVEAVSRVEILRGPASAAHGGGALAAVINVVTFSADDFQGISASGGVGSFDTGELALRVGNRMGGVGLAGYVHFLDHSGAKLAVPEDAQTVIDRGQPEASAISLAPGRTSDGLRTLETNYRASFRELTAGVRVKSESSGGYIGATDALGRQNDVNDRQVGADLAWARALRGGASLEVSVSYLTSQVRQLLELFPSGFERPTPGADSVTQFPNGALFQSSLNSRRFGAEAVFQKAGAGRHRVVAGGSFARESSYALEARANLDYRDGTPLPELRPLAGALGDLRRSVGSLFAFDTVSLSSRASATLGARWDHGSDYGDEFSPHAALVAALREDLDLKLVYGRSFRPPSFTELAFELPGYLPDPALRPVRLHAAEASLSLSRGDLQLSATYFLNWLRDPIGPDRPVATLAPARLVNLPGANVSGLELELRRSFGLGSAIFASYTFQRAEERDSGLAVPGVPEDMLSVGGTLSFRERVSATPYLLFRGRRLRADGDARSPQDAYALVNLNVRARRVARNLELWATALNLFDTTYSDPSPPWGVPTDYPRPGRSLYFGAAYKF
jgi:iron complex outermembrane receptor protein